MLTMRYDDLRIRLSNNIAPLRSDHHSLGDLTLVGILHRFEKAARDTSSSLDTRFVVELAITIRWTILDPMPWKNMKLTLT